MNIPLDGFCDHDKLMVDVEVNEHHTELLRESGQLHRRTRQRQKDGKDPTDGVVRYLSARRAHSHVLQDVVKDCKRFRGRFNVL